MSHTLHRVGSVESLSRDIVFTCMPSKNINHEGSGPKLRRFLEICREQGAIKIGDARKGNEYIQGSIENLLSNVEDRAVVQAVFCNQVNAIAALKAIKEAHLGLSVVISGLFEQTKQCCNRAGLIIHTINQSLGRWGRVDKLPAGGVLELNTMCGHGMVTVGFIQKIGDKVRRGKWTSTEAAEELFKCCVCGVFNTERAAGIIETLTQCEGK